MENVIKSFKTNKNRDTSHCAKTLKKYKPDKPNAKISQCIANEIRGKYMPNVYPLSKLAKEYNVSKKTILLIIKNKIWV